jgi:two-component system, OmpR family, sensor histidine kinase ArlS
MLLKHRFPLFFSFLFSLLLAIVLLTVYYLFYNFRKDEFKNRLAEKAESSVKLLLEVKEIDRQLLRIIDTNSINRLYNEKTIIFDSRMEIIYSSIDDAVINWTKADLAAMKAHREVFRKDGAYDVLGINYHYGGEEYYVFVSAEDTSGVRNLHFLRLILIGAAIAGTIAVWLMAFVLSKRTLRPLDTLRRQMQEITSKNLTFRVKEPKKDDEIKALSQSFNQMLDRIDKAYKGQKEFTSNASHELRTPIARIMMQLENLAANPADERDTHAVLKSTIEDAYHLSDIVTSLLVLSKTEEAGDAAGMQPVRMDEIVFQTATQLSKFHPDFKLNFEIDDHSSKPITMEVMGDEMLLRIALQNLLKNAYAYSDNQLVRCIIGQEDGCLQLTITNSGEVPVVADTNQLFQAFARGSNSAGTQGSGIGLSIVRRILHHHGATILYQLPDERTNQIVLRFPNAKV